MIRWLKFNLVGGIGIGVQLAALATLKTGLHLNYLLATTLAVETAVIHNFFWHERFTWIDRPSESKILDFFKFNLTNGALSIVGNMILMKLFVGVLHFPYLIANLTAIAVCSIANFLLSDHIVFRKPAFGRN
jgi:putative flippase GtrA